MYSFCAMYSLRMSFCSVPETCFRTSTPCFSATARYMAKRIGAVELMVIEVGDLARAGCRRTASPCRPGCRPPRRTCPPRPCDIVMVGVVAVERRQVEGDREAGLALREQVLEALVGVGGGAEAGELPHRPELAAVAGRVDAARVRELAGDADLALRVEVRRLLGGDEVRHLHAGDRGEVLLPERHLGLGLRLRGLPALPRLGHGLQGVLLVDGLGRRRLLGGRLGQNGRLAVLDGHAPGLLSRGRTGSRPTTVALRV